jgi:hypothetical protein
VREVVETSLHSDGAPRFELTCDDTTGPQIRARRYHTIGGIHCGEHLTPRVLRLSKACSKNSASRRRRNLWEGRIRTFGHGAAVSSEVLC